jgi:predicted O-methyltransferase YrrM
MKTSWTLGLNEEATKDVLVNFKESLVMRKRLSQLLLDELEGIRKEARAKDLYDSPSWAFHQADKMGYERALYKILGLLED